MNKKFYIIKFDAQEHGFFSHFIHLLSGINYSINNGLIPVVDWTHLTLSYLDKDMEESNPFEYYFEQPYSIDDAHSNIHIVSPHGFARDIFGDFNLYHRYRLWDHHEVIKKWNEIFNKNLKIKERILLDLNKEITKHKTLGVHCRRSDMVSGHPEIAWVLNLDETYQKVLKIFNENKFEKIYLATEEVEILDFFKSKFDDKLIYQDCWRADIGVNEWAWFHYRKNDRKFHNFLKGKEVLVDSLNLSLCESLICSISGVSYASLIFNNCKYSNVYYFDEI